jgi:hypothetical protein
MAWDARAVLDKELEYTGSWCRREKYLYCWGMRLQLCSHCADGCAPSCTLQGLIIMRQLRVACCVLHSHGGKSLLHRLNALPAQCTTPSLGFVCSPRNETPAAGAAFLRHFL